MISITILTKNSAETLPATLASVKKFPEILVFDTGSTDATIEMARGYRIIQEPFQGFGKAHNRASELAQYDWILSIDSDEVLSSELIEEILSLKLDPTCVYAIERENYFLGKRMRGCSGWYPDWVVRLYNKKHTQFSDDAVHEKVLSEGFQVVRLRHPLKHTPYRTLADLERKKQVYTDLFAQQNHGKKKSSWAKAALHGVFAFLKSYFLKRGFLCGKEGYILSRYIADTAYQKYLKLAAHQER